MDPKARTIAATTLGDRVVDHARVLEPRFEPRFIHHGYACRSGKGQHRALKQSVRWARPYRSTMVLDVRRLVPRIDHEAMRRVLFQVVRDPEVPVLAAHIIHASAPSHEPALHFPGDELFTPLRRTKGLQIGNLTSQFFANVLLDQVDDHVKQRLRVKA